MPTKKVAPAKAKKVAAKPTTKQAPSKARTKTTVKQAEVSHRTLRRSEITEPFFTFRISHQTLYWLILAGVVLFLGLWVTDISLKVQRIYDQIDSTNAAMF